MNRNKTPWPTDMAMIQIYEKHLWGGTDYDFYSGVGSHDFTVVNPYLKGVSSFLESFDDKLTVCDLGCGDFNIGKELVGYTKFYHAIDIVPNLIKRNVQKYNVDNLLFSCKDIVKDDWPEADCVILRQVLQHLSNEEIGLILKKVRKYEYLILTEHIPEGTFESNIDIISGQGIRLKKNSGVDIFSKPFNFDAKNINQLSSVKSPDFGGIIETKLIEPNYAIT